MRGEEVSVWVNVMMSVNRGGGYLFPTKPTQELKLFQMHCLKFRSQISAETVLLLLLFSMGCFGFSSYQTCQPWTF